MAGELGIEPLLDRFYSYKEKNLEWYNDTGEIIITGYQKEDDSILIVQFVNFNFLLEYDSRLKKILKGDVILYLCGDRDPMVCDSDSIGARVIEECLMRKFGSK
jgi:hypothetical protein